jgi:hypothetical protein
MLDEPRRDRAFAQPQMALEDSHGARAQDDAAILTRLRDILIDAIHARFGNTQRALRRIVIGDDERNLFGRAKAREKAQLIVIPVRVAPVTMQRGDEYFGVLNTERIILLLPRADTLEALTSVRERRRSG